MRTITIELEVAARRSALAGSPHIGPLPARSRRALEAAHISTPVLSIETWTVACSVQQARALLDWYEEAADALFRVGDDDQARACGRAADAILAGLRSP